MPNGGFSIDVPGGGTHEAGERVAVDESTAQGSIADPNAPDLLTWDQLTAARDQVDAWRTPYKDWVFANAGIDGYGFEIAVDAATGFGTVGDGLEPTGLSLLWITDSEADPSSDDVDVDPLANPHYFMFSAESVASGTGSAGDVVTAEYFYASRFGPAPTTRGTWSGVAVSGDVEADTDAVLGSEVAGSAFSSLDYDTSGPHGALNFGPSESGWRGVSFSADVRTGPEVEFAVGSSAAFAYETAVDYLGRSDVEGAFEDDPSGPEEGDFGYRRDGPAGSWLGWLEDMAAETSGESQ